MMKINNYLTSMCKQVLFTFLVLAFSNNMLFSNEDILDAPIIQPGAPGEPSKSLNEEDATNIANTSYIKADVNFLQGMIIHHQQAIVMSNMAGNRTNNKVILELAK